MNPSNYKRSDLWFFFFENNITKQHHAETKFQEVYGKKVNPTIKTTKRWTKSLQQSSSKTERKKAAEKKLFPAPLSDRFLFEDVQLDSDSSSNGEEDDGPSDFKRARGDYKPFASLSNKLSNRLS